VHLPDYSIGVPTASQHQLIHVVRSVNASFRRQRDVRILDCLHLERHRTPASQHYTDVDVPVSLYHEHAICSDTPAETAECEQSFNFSPRDGKGNDKGKGNHTLDMAPYSKKIRRSGVSSARNAN